MNEEQQNGYRPTDFDYLLADPQLQMVKAALPYMQLPQQRILSMMIKMRELNRTRELFRDGELSAMGLGSAGAKKAASPMEIIQTIKQYAGPREREMIDMLENIQLMMQAMQTPT